MSACMPQFICRATGADCDYLYRSDDFHDVLVNSLKHAETEHPENIDAALKKINVSGIVVFVSGHIKD